ncbi:MAG: SOS response-associated peptidase [Thermogutta sp.]
MCGRFTLRTDPKTAAEHFALAELPLLEPRYNIAPGQPVDLIRDVPAGAASHAAQLRQRRREWNRAHWGLVPQWAKTPSQAGWINARAETAATRPAFRVALRYRRCLIPADGFYEWKRLERRKQPYFIRFRDDRLFAFAGIWESRDSEDGSQWESCAILTTAPNALMSQIHDRMPVILRPQDYADWLDLDIQDPAALRPLLRPYPAEEMEAFPVGGYVNAPVHEGPRCLERGEITGSLF